MSCRLVKRAEALEHVGGVGDPLGGLVPVGLSAAPLVDRVRAELLLLVATGGGCD